MKVKYIGNDTITDALFNDKEYDVIFESDKNYLIHNEVQSNGIYDKEKFEIVSED